MNKVEQSVAWELEALKREGKIKSWDRKVKPLVLCESSLRTGRPITYTPDFVVDVLIGGYQRRIFIEVKGPHLWEDSYIKFEWARRFEGLYHFVWYEPSRNSSPKTIAEAIEEVLK